MISVAIGVACLLIGGILVWKIVGQPTHPNRRRKVDPHYFKSLELEVPERPTAQPWAATATTFRRPLEPLEFDFEPEPEEEIQPIGLAGNSPLLSERPDPVEKRPPTRGFGFVDRDEEDEGPQQGTLGF